jgi:hypothetical protein
VLWSFICFISIFNWINWRRSICQLSSSLICHVLRTFILDSNWWLLFSKYRTFMCFDPLFCHNNWQFCFWRYKFPWTSWVCIPCSNRGNWRTCFCAVWNSINCFTSLTSKTWLWCFPKLFVIDEYLTRWFLWSRTPLKYLL